MSRMSRFNAALRLDSANAGNEQVTVATDREEKNQVSVQIPKIYIERVIINTVQLEPKPSRIAAELLLSAKIPQQKPYLNFLKSNYVKINIIEVRNEKWKQLLQKSTEFIQKIVDDKFDDINNLFLKLAKQYKLIYSDDRNKLKESFKKYCTIHEIKGIPSTDKIARTSELQSGEIGLNYYFKHITELAETDHLSFFVYADYDKEKIAEEQNNINVVQENAQISAEMIINKGKICSLTYVFYDKNDVIWTGEIHERGPGGAPNGKGVWYKGKMWEYNRNTAEILTRRPYYNTKIQDFRAILQIQKKADLVNGLEEQKKLIDEYFIQKNKYNGAVYKETDTVVKFVSLGGTGPILRMYCEDFLKKYSKIYNFFSAKPSYNKNNIIKDSRAYKIRAKRFRSNGFAYASTEQFVPFQKNEQKQYIDIKVEPKVDGSYGRSSFSYSIIEFTISDPSFNTEYAEYCYGIELLVVDPLIDWLRNFIEELRDANKSLEEYYEISKLEEYYDLQTNMFTSSFSEWYNNQKQNSINLESIRATFIEALKYVGVDDDNDELSNNIGLMTNPNSGTPASVLYFINSMKHIASIFEKLYLNCKKEKYIKIEKLYDNITERKRQQLRRAEMSLDIGTTEKELQRFQDLTSATLLDQNGDPLINGFYPIPEEALEKAESWRTRVERSRTARTSQPFFDKLGQTKTETSISQRNVYVPSIMKKEVSSQQEHEKQKNTDKKYSKETKGANSSNLQVDNATMNEVFQKVRRRG